MVAKGFIQLAGLDYQQTLSHVYKFATTRTILSIVVIYGWQIQQMDIKNAFFCHIL